MTNDLVAAGGGGFLAWVAIEGVRYFVLRARLVRYLVIQINIHLRGAHSNKEWLIELAKTHSTAGVIPQGAPRYSTDRAEDLHESRDLVLRYLTRDEIERITKFLNHLWEVEYLTEGVCEAIGAYAKKGDPLKPEDCSYLQHKVARVSSVVEKWPRSIKRLRELPIDYSGVKGPDAVPVPPKRRKTI